MKHSLNDPLPKRPAYDWSRSLSYDDGESEWDRPLTLPERSFWRGVVLGAVVEAGVVVLIAVLWWLL